MGGVGRQAAACNGWLQNAINQQATTTGKRPWAGGQVLGSCWVGWPACNASGANQLQASVLACQCSSQTPAPTERCRRPTHLFHLSAHPPTHLPPR